MPTESFDEAVAKLHVRAWELPDEAKQLEAVRAAVELALRDRAVSITRSRAVDGERVLYLMIACGADLDRLDRLAPPDAVPFELPQAEAEAIKSRRVRVLLENDGAAAVAHHYGGGGVGFTRDGRLRSSDA